MSLATKRILGISFTSNTKEEILEYVIKYLLSETKDDRRKPKIGKKPLVIATPNPEQIMYAKVDSHFADLLNQADIALPDGIGIVLAGNVLASGHQSIKMPVITNTIPGTEFMEDLAGLAAKESFPIALIGGRGGVALKAFECLQARFSGLTGWAEDGPEIEISDMNGGISYNGMKGKTEVYAGNLGRRLRDTHVKFVFIGLGAPKQELFIERLTTHNLQPTTLPPLVLMSVGGSFDEIAGMVPRPPVFLKRFGLKWLWRLVSEPWRFRRQIALLRFMVLVFQEKLKTNF